MTAADRGPLRRGFDLAYRRTARNPADKATVQLGQMLCDQLDRAEVLSAAASALAAALVEQGDPIGAANARKLADGLSARQAVADLGPKLLAVLAALHMTTAARVAVEKSTKDAADDPAETELRRLRQRAAKRRGTAPAMDSPAAPADS